MNRLLITGARVLTPEATDAPLASILIEDGRIAAILPPDATVEDAARHDATGRLVIPGLVNSHTHGHGGLAKGAGDKWDLALLLAHAPWVGGGRGLAEKRLSTTLAAVEMLKKGCTASFDLTAEFPGPTLDGLDSMAEAYAEVGLRAVLAPMVADRSFFQATPGLIEALPEPHQGRAAAIRMAESGEILATIGAAAKAWRHGPAGVALGIAPTIPLHCSDDFMRGCQQLAGEHGLRMQTHVSEARYQAAGGEVLYGSTLLAHMDRLGLVTPRFSVAHGVWLTPQDLDLLAARGAGLAHNPGANMRLASGIAPVRAAIRAGVTVGIGTDGSSSSDNQNMFESMRLAAFASRLWDGAEDDDWLGTAETVRLATEGSAAIMGLEAGSIAPGRLADLVFLDLDHINWLPLNNVANQLVWTEDSSAVRDVMVGGSWKLRQGRVLGLDEARLATEAREAAARLLTANAEVRRWCEAIAPHVACHCRALAGRFTRVQRLLKAD
ncbi:amidohydrolase family protein [Roseomonas marmotae]|uniref:Amidohydrolase family protein n=1 Tax=Roseomonas marmotae TaxID=2768161 RepID=A0ABS3KBY6_9PROT|nr:amidohydrolase family protein [Roseomonas marmotae]MBO1074420.1 amidohydrolase family protein [Roseomonas marmotae]QTI78157.1 amidohydrolase family protein [Roseomonas marmotae]